MKNVKVSKIDLLAKVLHNRKVHEEEYKEMMITYKVKLIDALELLVDEAKDSDRGFTKSVNLSEPQNHADDYNRIISMLEMSIDNDITLDFHEYEQYVLNNWHWSGNFNVSKASYMDS